MNSQKCVLITGGCGFIGSNLVDYLLERQWQVRILDNLSVGSAQAVARRGVDLRVGDIRDYGIVSKAVEDVAGVVHLAGQTGVIPSVQNPQEDFEINGGGTLNILKAAVEHQVKRFVFASSNAPLGEQNPPVDEEKVPHPLSPYGASKLAGEGYCSAFYGSFGLGTVVLRFANVYGPRSTHKSSVVAEFIRRLLANEPLIVYGNGLQTRDFVHVTDLCQAISLALESTISGEIFQIASGTETSILDLVQYLQTNFSDRTINIQFAEARAGEITRNYSNIGKARQQLGFVPAISLEQELAETCLWFLQQASKKEG